MRLIESVVVILSCISFFVSANWRHDLFAKRAEARAMLFERQMQQLEQEQSKSKVLPRGRHVRRSSRYLNKDTQKFAVNPFSLPLVPFDIGESYSGLLPISDKANETRQLFFWFFPSENPAASDEISIWLNGGPGCSSFFGVLQENGPISWMPGTEHPVRNSYSWTNLTNMIWIEQPVGVGFSAGEPSIAGEDGLAKQFLGFWKNFMKTFRLENRKVYLIAESYGGFYGPYIAKHMLDAQDTRYYNMKGLSLINPIVGGEELLSEVALVPYIKYWNNLMYLNDTFVKDVEAVASKRGYTAYYNKYFKFPPPPGPFPHLRSDSGLGSYLSESIYNAAVEVNKCFDAAHITDTCPNLWSVMGNYNYNIYQTEKVGKVYFNREEVKKALHAPLDVVWAPCTRQNVFPKATNKYGDDSLPPSNNGVLASVIERTNNVMLGIGELDMSTPATATLIQLQNITWHGVQGFQSRPQTPFYVPYHSEILNSNSFGGAGIQGYWSEERGLTFYTVRLAGHEIPEYNPAAAFRALEVLLGRVPDLSSREDFTTQSGNFTGHTEIGHISYGPGG